MAGSQSYFLYKDLSSITFPNRNHFGYDQCEWALKAKYFIVINFYRYFCNYTCIHATHLCFWTECEYYMHNVCVLGMTWFKRVHNNVWDKEKLKTWIGIKEHQGTKETDTTISIVHLCFGQVDVRVSISVRYGPKNRFMFSTCLFVQLQNFHIV